MALRDGLRLILLAAIWGGSFIFMRVIAPVFGAVPTAALRLSIAGIALILYFRLIRFDVEWKKFWRQYFVIGTLNSAVPFSLFAFAAQHIPAYYSATINSTSPLFGALFSAIWLREKITMQKMVGLLLGAGGVALFTRAGGGHSTAFFEASIAACLVAAACYGLTGVYIKRCASNAKSKAIAGASQLVGGLLLLPSMLYLPAAKTITPLVASNLLALSLLCSAIAYLIYYRLIAEIGPTKALTVTFLVPVFGLWWGILFLGEIPTWSMASGTSLVIAGTVLVVSSRS